ncbi:MAG: SCO family protein [Alphaproteobacteria bacterium]|nr:SCO family protein [Alphaproteobacteria bacterium]
MKRPPSVAIIPILLLLTVVAAGALWRLGDLRSQQGVQTIESKLVELGGAFALTDQDGMRRTDADFRGKYMLVFFGYTFCPDVCPTTLAVQAEALKILGGQATRIVPVFITVDPKRDTPEVLKSYLAAFGPDFIGLSGDEAEITQVTKAYRVFYQAHAEEGDNYTVDHSGVVYLMSPEGKFVANYSLDTSPDMMAADLRRKTRAVR